MRSLDMQLKLRKDQTGDDCRSVLLYFSLANWPAIANNALGFLFSHVTLGYHVTVISLCF